MIFNGEETLIFFKGERGEKGERGDKGEKGDLGEVITDKTLSLFGNAADAKVTGENIRDNARKIDMLIGLSEGQGLIGAATIEDDFTYRKTADGLNVVDGSPATVNKIRGATVKSKNLFDISKIETHYWKHSSNNQYAHITNNGDGTLTIECVGYTIPLGVTLRQVCPSLKVGDKVVCNGFVDGVAQNTFQAVNWLYAATAREITEEMLNAELLINGKWNGGDAVTSTWTNIQIEIAGASTEYTPYFAGLKNAHFEKIISTGRNLINIPDQNITITSSDNNPYKNVDLGFRLKSNTTYTISYDYNVQSVNGTIETYVDRFVEDDNGKVVPASGLWTDFTNTLSNGKAVCTFTTSTITKGKDRLFVRFVRLESAGDLQATATNIMLNFGNTALTYEPYTESVVGLTAPQELGKWDYINPQTGELVKGTKTIVFDGTESWEKAEQGNVGVGLTYKPVLRPNDTVGVCVCNLYDFIPSNSGDGVYVVENAFVVAKGIADNYTVDEWKAQLVKWKNDGTPLTVSYQLKNPTIAQINIPKSYVAYQNGSETVVQGATGETPTTEIKYYVAGVEV